MKKSALIAALAIVAFAPAASEAKAPASKGCPMNSLCVWTKPDYEGKKLVIKDEGASNKVANQMNNKVSSVKSRYSNSDGDAAYLFDRRNANGDYFCLGAGLGKKIPNLGPPYGFDNRTSSVLLPKSDEGPICF